MGHVDNKCSSKGMESGRVVRVSLAKKAESVMT